MAKPKAAPAPIAVEDNPLDDYFYEVGVIAEDVLAQGGTSRDRQMIRQTSERHIAALQAEAKKRNKRFVPITQNRLNEVARGLAIGVTKSLEAWEYVSINRAWPPEDSTT